MKYAIISHNNMNYEGMKLSHLVRKIMDESGDDVPEKDAKIFPYCVYCITNKENNKKYIGRTNNLERRISEHISVSYGNSKKKMTINKAIVKYGIFNFEIKILDKHSTLEESKKSEALFVSQYEASNNDYGYNETSGGEDARSIGVNNRKFSNEQIYNIFLEFCKENISTYDLECMFNTDRAVIANILKRKTYSDVYISEEILDKTKIKMKQKDTSGKTNKFIIDKIKEDSKNMSVKMIAEKYSINQGYIRRIIKDKKFLTIKNSNNINNQNIDLIINDYLYYNMSMERIASKYQISFDKINGFFSKFGLQKYNVSEENKKLILEMKEKNKRKLDKEKIYSIFEDAVSGLYDPKKLRNKYKISHDILMNLLQRKIYSDIYIDKNILNKLDPIINNQKYFYFKSINKLVHKEIKLKEIILDFMITKNGRETAKNTEVNNATIYKIFNNEQWIDIYVDPILVEKFRIVFPQYSNFRK